MHLDEKNLIIRNDILEIVEVKLPWHKLKNKKILVTGGGGFLGSYMVKSLLALNDIYNLNLSVFCLSRSQQSIEYRLKDYKNNKYLKFIIKDITNIKKLELPEVDYIIHTASQASPKFYGTDPVGTLTANTIGTINLFESAVSFNVEKILFFSSGEVYGNTEDNNTSIKEFDYGYLDPLKIRSCYGESKRMGENICVAYSHQYKINCSIVRPFHTYGPGLNLNDGRVFADFVSDVVNKKNISINSDGLSSRCFCYISEATKAFLTVLLKGDNREAYNIANPSCEISIKDLAKVLKESYPERVKKINILEKSSNNLYLPSQIKRSYPNIEKIAKLGWQPSISIKNGFERTVNSFLV